MTNPSQRQRPRDALHQTLVVGDRVVFDAKLQEYDLGRDGAERIVVKVAHHPLTGGAVVTLRDPRDMSLTLETEPTRWIRVKT